MTPGLTLGEKQAIEDLQNSPPNDDTDGIGGDGDPDLVDEEHLRERASGDDAFVEELKERLRPLSALPFILSIFPSANSVQRQVPA